MNLLVHYLLSGRETEVIVGNVIADFLKGSNHYQLKPGIEKGIALHKQIDKFSDSHSSVRETWKLLFPHFGLYGRVITDIYFDFCLYHHWNEFSEYDFEDDMQFLYYSLRVHAQDIPPHIRRTTTRIIALQWPKKYTTYHGLFHVFRSMSRRVSFHNNFELAIDILKKHYDEIEHNFLRFYPEIHTFVQTMK